MAKYDPLARVSAQDWEMYRPLWEEFILLYLRPARKYHHCYALKQRLTRKTQYLYEYDMFLLLTDLGFVTKRDKKRGFLAKAEYNQKAMRDAITDMPFSSFAVFY